jgi:hypothetical protein
MTSPIVTAAPRSRASLLSADRSSLDRELARCDAEIAGMQNQSGVPAWLVALGILDWEAEKRFIRAELEACS